MQTKYELKQWVAGVRGKFRLPYEEIPPSASIHMQKEAEYWRGYNDCLSDVERLAERVDKPDRA